MASISCDQTASGRYKIRWREPAVVEGVRKMVARSETVVTKEERDLLIARVRRDLVEHGHVRDLARPEEKICSLEEAARAWLRERASQGLANSSIEVGKSAMKRFFGTARELLKIPADAPVPGTAMTRDLFARVLIQWRAEDTDGARKAGETRLYDLARDVYRMWVWAADEPETWPGVPRPPRERKSILPRPPVRTHAPPAATWAEADAVVRRAFELDEDLGLITATMRCTGLRVGQVEPLKPEDFDLNRLTMVVRVGKSRMEKAEQRTIAIGPVLGAVLRERISATPKGAFLFPPLRDAKSGHRQVDSNVIRALWETAVVAGEARAEVVDPPQRRKGRPNHAFRACFMTGLKEARVNDSVLDFLVGHHPESVRDRSYVPPDINEQREAVAAVPEIDRTGPAGGNVVAIADRRKKRGA